MFVVVNKLMAGWGNILSFPHNKGTASIQDNIVTQDLSLHNADDVWRIETRLCICYHEPIIIII